MNDKISMNTETLQAKVAGNDNDIRHLLRLVGDLSSKYALLERTINGRKTVVNGHTSAMPDYKGENRDHDARYATKRYVASVVDSIPPATPVTVADTPSIDMTVSGQQISAETIGLTATITFVE
jgi:hypothetical protein